MAVCDTFNFRIQVWNGGGSSPTFQRNIGGTKPTNGGFNGAFAVAYGPDGSLYAADWFNHRIQKFNANGSTSPVGRLRSAERLADLPARHRRHGDR